MKHIKTINQLNKLSENSNISDINTDDLDEKDFYFAKWIFEQEEGRAPNMNNMKDMNAVAMIEVGVRYARNYS